MCETWLVCGGLSGIICDMVFALVWASTDTRWEFLAAPSVGGTPGFGVCPLILTVLSGWRKLPTFLRWAERSGWKPRGFSTSLHWEGVA